MVGRLSRTEEEVVVEAQTRTTVSRTMSSTSYAAWPDEKPESRPAANDEAKVDSRFRLAVERNGGREIFRNVADRG
jgi:hypothetical protein